MPQKPLYSEYECGRLVANGPNEHLIAHLSKIIMLRGGGGSCPARVRSNPRADAVLVPTYTDHKKIVQNAIKEKATMSFSTWLQNYAHI